MYSEDDLLPLSALQHLAFCERQWALIHLEGVWAENRFTVEGRQFHDRVDATETEVRGDLRIARGLRLRALKLGLSGRADVVEFHRVPEAASGDDQTTHQTVSLPDTPGRWRPVPVEYKRGKPKADLCDEVQLCAQALCLEEMLDVAIPAGMLFYGKTRRRYDVAFSDTLRAETISLTGRLQELTEAAQTPQAVYERKCNVCSLVDVCLPKATGPRRSAQAYLNGVFKEIGEAPERNPHETAS